MRQLLFTAAACFATFITAVPARAASPLDGKTYQIEMSSGQSKSGYGDYLLPPLLRVLAGSRLKPAKAGPAPM